MAAAGRHALEWREMPRLSVLTVTLAGLLLATPAWAQQLTLKMHEGRVSVTAVNVPLRQVLTEWARVGGVTIVNADKVAGPLVTLTLPDVTERQALDALLRGVSGYMLAARPAGRPGASAYDRILILPTSAAPPPVRASGPAPRPMPAQPMAMQNDDDEPSSADDTEPPVVANSGYARPFPAGGANGQPQVFPPVRGPIQGAPATPSPVTSGPTNPFGRPAGSGAPGVVTPVPPPPPVGPPPTNP